MSPTVRTFFKRRVACVFLPEVRIEMAQEREERRAAGEWLRGPESSELLAIVISRPGGAVLTERDVLGGTRLDVVSKPARALGVHPGFTVAAGRAQCAALRVRVLPQEAVRSALERVAETALAFGPSVATSVDEDVVWVEIGGCAHLHGGDRELAVALAARVRALGHSCRIAIADGPRIASAVARFGGGQGSPPPTSQEGEAVVVVPQGESEKTLRTLPLEALPLDSDAASWCRNLGFLSCGDLQRLPRRALGIRLGERAREILQLLAGEDCAPLDAWRPPEVPEERIELDWGAASVQALTFLVRPLCEKLAARLQGRGMATSRLELVLGLDRGLCEAEPETKSRPGPPKSATVPLLRLEVILPSPLVRSGDFFAVLGARLERVTLEAPVMAVTLRASDLTAAAWKPLKLLSPEPKAGQVLPRLAAELGAELGEDRVGILELRDTWVAFERTQLAPWQTAGSNRVARHPLVTAALEPSRIVPPFSIRLDRVSNPELLARIECIEWWRQTPCRRDFVAAWVERDVSGSGPASDADLQDGALAWVELRNEGQSATIRGWID